MKNGPRRCSTSVKGTRTDVSRIRYFFFFGKKLSQVRLSAVEKKTDHGRLIDFNS